MTKIVRVLVTCVVLTLVASLVSAQGVQTGTLSGTVRDQGGLPLPGVGRHRDVAGPSGLRASRPPTATASTRWPGCRPACTRCGSSCRACARWRPSQRVDLGQTARVDATLQVAVAETRAGHRQRRPSIITSTQGGANLRADDMAKLANIRTVWGIAELAPGLTDNTPNANQLTIAGGFAYDNQFLINGVDVADNIFGTPNNLFIEDALAGGAGADLGHLGRVRPLRRRRGQRHHQERRQHVQRQRRASTSTARRGRKETPFETGSNVVRQKDVQQNYEVDVRRAGGQGPAVVLHGGPVAERLDARAAARDRHPLLDRDHEQARASSS